MSTEARDNMLATLRRSLGVTGREAPRRDAVRARIDAARPGVIPARGQLDAAARADLPDNHVVVVSEHDVAGDLETVLGRIRDLHGKGQMPRTINLVTGPSRSADIEQTLILGAHGPRRLHIVVVAD